MFPLRPYDPATGRWVTVDPYDQFDSPYVGMGNDPISGIDPDGGYTKFGAWVRALFTSGVSTSDIYESGGEWGFNTQENDATVFNYGHHGKRSGIKFYNPGGLGYGKGDGNIGIDPKDVTDITVVTLPEQLPSIRPQNATSADGRGNPPSSENWATEIKKYLDSFKFGQDLKNKVESTWKHYSSNASKPNTTSDRQEAKTSTKNDQSPLVRRIFYQGRWIILDTLDSYHPKTIDSLIYDDIKDLPSWKNLDLN